MVARIPILCRLATHKRESVIDWLIQLNYFHECQESV